MGFYDFRFYQTVISHNGFPSPKIVSGSETILPTLWLVVGAAIIQKAM